VAEGVDPEHILVLTFGRRGAARLRDRIESRLGDRTTMAEPMVRTFPGYAFGLLRRAAVDRGDPPPRLLTAPEQDLVIRELLAGGSTARWPETLEAALPTRAFATELRDLLLRAIERGVDPAGLGSLAVRLKRPDWAAAARFFAEYLDVLALRDATARGSAAFDYAELVRAATAMLDDPSLLAAERRRLEYIYVDELADTDPTQVELLGRIAGAHLVAFADSDSSTFAFRGSDPAIVGAFSDRFRDARGRPAPRVTLLRSYRMNGATGSDDSTSGSDSR